MLQLTYYWHLYYLLTPLCNHWIPQFPYLHLRPPYLFLSSSTSLLLVLQHFCIHQNFQTLTTLNSVFTLWTFRLTSQNLQRLLIFPMSLLSIINLLIFSAKPKLKLLLLIILMTSKSIQKKMLNLQLALYTLFLHLNKKFSRNSLRKTSIYISSDQPSLCIVHQSYSSRRKIVHYTSVLTFTVLTTFPKRITIHSHSSLIYQTHCCSNH